MGTEQEKEELERICLNCSSFLPASPHELTEFGICLNDEEFEPFIDELLGKSNYDCCKDLIELKKFPGEREACPDFDIGERIEIDDNSELGRAILSALEKGPLDPETFERLLLEEQIRNTDFTTLPIDEDVKQLKSPKREERDAALTNLENLAGLGNKAAFQEVFNYLQQLPPLTTIEEVHFKLGILERLNRPQFRPLLTKYLLDELYNTPSNATTRQWISAILELLRRCPLEDVREPLEKMLSEKRFSYRLKKKVEYLLYELEYGI